MGDDLKKQLIEDAGIYGISIDEEQANCLLKHLALVLKENETTNLTRVTDPKTAVDIHIVDSLLITKYVNDGCRYLDIGSGAGYPGIPVAVVRKTNTLLIDSVGKKTRALERMVFELGLDQDIEVLQCRAEELALTSPAFDCVTARAVSSVDVLLEYGAPLLRIGGILILSKGPAEELDDHELRGVCELCGMDEVSRETFELPHNRGTRRIFIFKKTGEPKIHLPRRVGMATKKPLREKV
ncbi:MAG: 16S rRNA (guanine(527)-N(7))-methyltransferase RsmG [Atopobiaceae bacterium]|jgi:16S rRNA (guanine527-N7)-methyltransferase|nr:16S rRNA (guanine(527)-N(7))-methyltransferase RsmG [Atopobiaceae bacterium]MCH4119901.1 16S rRNA (guanine(527)-N(7))-methyltransferase RsmG [Atopobiaceae bacterium]MCI1318463.1 16S rRNA (guanine(527)-N(7))-methyltransferase RsmG [Atopobiaceae bacterium]MCI1389182.1 16S rRNA (guanine(527)-N(7))-methyltransferase RsmG [Atopobiaceae bacterium]MCI1432807.1 16S rRNA (guanine(527)-N(7))-methyltransferase RsmG [Atopobiaceae bacterium]